MLLLIDAYNLMHHSDALERRRDARWLQRARERLLKSLAKHLPDDVARQTCLVFDAARPPAGAVSELVQFQIQVLYAVNHDEADDLIEELIAKHPTPKRLTVVSSDHRIHRAAARRGVTCFDADPWYDELLDKGPRLAIGLEPKDGSGCEERESEKPQMELTAEELAEWLRHFGNNS